jgi:hypothetical protein
MRYIRVETALPTCCPRLALVDRCDVSKDTLHDLPDMEALEDAGLLDARIPLGNGFAEETPEEDE